MVEVKVDGIVRGFVFGTNTIRIFRGLTGIETIEDIFNGIGNKDKVRTQIDHIGFLNDFLWACAQDYCRRNKQPMDFTPADVSDWFEEIGIVETRGVLDSLIKSYVEKNRKAPQQGPNPPPQEQL